MRYTIDYGYGIATLYTPSADWENRFCELASQCFGIRKSVAKVELVEASEGEPAYKFEGECERLVHSGDLIIWDKDGNKIKSEWD